MKHKSNKKIKSKKNLATKKYRLNRIGLHCHCKDDKEHLIKLLEMAKKENVGTLVVNNYKSMKVYTEILKQLSDEELEKFKTIKMLPSIEMPARYEFCDRNGNMHEVEVHIIGFGVDLDKEDLLKKFCAEKYKENKITEEQELERLIKKGKELGLKFNPKDCYIDENDESRKFAGRAFITGVMQNPNLNENFMDENENISSTFKLPAILRKDPRSFYNMCVKKPQSPFYRNDIVKLNPDVSEVINLIHQMGGKAYLAHPTAYFVSRGKKEELDLALDFATQFMGKFARKKKEKINTKSYNNSKNESKCKIDGIEMYHPTYPSKSNDKNSDVMDFYSELEEILKRYRLATSGGTDIHVDQTLKPGENISGGKNTMNTLIKKKLKEYRYIRRKSKTIKELKKCLEEIEKNNAEIENEEEALCL